MTFATKVSPRRTICEVHREIYDILYDSLADSPHFAELESRLQESYQMAKRMDAKLRQYKNGYDKGWWERQDDRIVKQKLKKRAQR